MAITESTNCALGDCLFTTEYGVQQVRPSLLNKSSSAFISAVQAEMSKLTKLRSIEIKDFDKECDFFEDDMVLSTKHKNEIAFIKFEPNNTSMYEYDQVFKRLCFINKQSPKRYVSLDLGDCRVAKKFYLTTYKAKDGRVDARLKDMFSVELKRDRDYIIGVVIAQNVKVGKLLELESDLIEPSEEESTHSNFKELLAKNNNSIYETLSGLFQVIIVDKIYDDEEDRKGIIDFLSELKETQLLSNDEKMKLNERFNLDLPEFIKVIMSQQSEVISSLKVENKETKKVEEDEEEWQVAAATAGSSSSSSSR